MFPVIPRHRGTLWAIAACLVFLLEPSKAHELNQVQIGPVGSVVQLNKHAVPAEEVTASVEAHRDDEQNVQAAAGHADMMRRASPRASPRKVIPAAAGRPSASALMVVDGGVSHDASSARPDSHPTSGALLPIILGAIVLSSFLCIMFAALYSGHTAKHPKEASVNQSPEGGEESSDAQSAPPSAEGSGEDQAENLKEKDVALAPYPLDEDLYGLCISMLIRDTQKSIMGSEVVPLRLSRVAISLLVLMGNQVLQLFLIVEMKKLVTTTAVHAIRENYDGYEVLMYPNVSGLTKNGYHRGSDANFHIENFDLMPDARKDEVCQIPLSQPTFLMSVILVWTLTCTSELRRTSEWLYQVAFHIPTIASMRDATVPYNPGDKAETDSAESLLITGLTPLFKAFVLIFILLPRLAVSAFLLWLGCRWLTATASFEDLMLNAVALEFVLRLKDLLYIAVVPDRNKRETRTMMFPPSGETERPTFCVFLGAFIWFMVAIVWCLSYMYIFQSVLPEYRWDIQVACQEYLAQQANGTASD